MMAGIYKQNDSENVKVIIGKLIEKADSNVRPVISVFDCFQNRQANLQRLNKFKVPPLESCAEFLGIALADKDNNKIFVKHTLVDRIYLGLMALMPAKCGECSEEYTIEHDPEQPPFFSCFRCFKGSHDCERNRKLHQTLSSLNTPSGFVWLCSTCHVIVDPIEPRKQRSRHPSTSGASTPNGNQTTDSSSNISNLAIQGLLSSTHNPSLQSSSINCDSSKGIVESESSSSADVCPRFLNWNCPHGISGKKQIGGRCCPLKHLRVCNQFRISGSIGRKGCKKGKNCAFFHPEICRAVSDSGSCAKRDCTKFHPRSSKKKEKNNPTNNVPRKSDNKQKNKKQNTNHANLRDCSSTDFLELRNLVTGMAAKLELLEKKMEQRAQPSQHAPPATMIHPASAHPSMMSLGVHRLHQPHFPYSLPSYC